MCSLAAVVEAPDPVRVDRTAGIDEPHRWDTRVVFVPRAGRWWWNAWDPVAEVERSGFADTRDGARAALAGAIDPAS